jgi:hypothetical protein
VTFKVKNTIYLACVCIVVIVLGFLIHNIWQPRQLKVINKKTIEINRQLEDLPGLTEEVQQLTEKYQDVKRRYDSRSKEIPLTDASSQTYSYMSNGMDQSGNIKFDMKFTGGENKDRWGYNVYKLTSGESTFEDLFRFVYFLENGRRLYKISSMNIDTHETIDELTKETIQSVTFQMDLQAYFVNNIPELGTSLAAKTLTMIPSIYNPCKPMVSQVMATAPPEGEIDADNSDVKAVLHGKAFVLANSELLILHVGDKVWRGSVTAIDPATSSVEYTLDEGGIVRKLNKRIKFDKKVK